MMDFIATQEQNLPDIEKSVKLIHRNKGEKQSRITIQTIDSLHKNLKKIVIDEGTDLKRFIHSAILEKCEKLGYPIKSKYEDLCK
ncbi:MAG: hypothetical protein AAF806_10405 [Bacteroidota bacterium]